MRPERWQQIVLLYHAALKREPGTRSAFLKEACQDDNELRAEIETLLRQDCSPDRPVWDAFGTSIGDPTCTVLSPGAQLGPYQIEVLLGAGGMGPVYKARDTRLGRAVAVKISAERFSTRFQREAKAISSLNHPNICTLYDVGSLASGAGYIVTELVEGETLQEWLKRAPPLERGLDIVRQVIQALRAAHEAGIVHRDLKPANIMVRFDGYVKVLDFGLAKRIAGTGGNEVGDTETADLTTHAVTCSPWESFFMKFQPATIRGYDASPQLTPCTRSFTMSHPRWTLPPPSIALFGDVWRSSHSFVFRACSNCKPHCRTPWRNGPPAQRGARGQSPFCPLPT